MSELLDAAREMNGNLVNPCGGVGRVTSPVRLQKAIDRLMKVVAEASVPSERVFRRKLSSIEEFNAFWVKDRLYRVNCGADAGNSALDMLPVS